jgi:hypothetical protein
LEHAEKCGEVDSVNGIDLIWFIVFNATCSNISAISWWPALVVEEAGVPIDQGQATGKPYHLLLRVHLFVIYKTGREPTPYWW